MVAVSRWSGAAWETLGSTLRGFFSKFAGQTCPPALFSQPWDIWSFDFDVGRLEFSHPDVFSGDVTQEPTLPSLQGATGEEQGSGWTSHLPEEFWDIRPILCDDESS